MNQSTSNTEIDEHHEELDKVHHASHKLGIVTIVLIFGLFGIWSVTAKIATTITAQGKVITQSYNKIVMHPQGGIIADVYVHEGDNVKLEQPLLALDSIKEQLEKDSNIIQHDNNLFAICRLNAEANISESIDCGSLKEELIQKEHFELLNKNAEKNYYSKMKVLEGKIRLLKSQNDVLYTRNDGLRKQIQSNENLRISYNAELKKWNKLLKANAVDELKAVEIERQVEQVTLEIEALKSQIDENLATIKSNEDQINLEKVTFENVALEEAKELKQKNELIYNQIKSLEHIIENRIIKSPSDGLITDMKIRAKGEVVSPQKPIMSIVPDNKDLMIEAFVIPTDIERVYTGQKVEISFPAFINPSALPIEGEITYVSADVITPENQKESFYTVLIKITPDGFTAIERNGFKIIPGMPSSAFVKTGKQTFMAYLMQPLVQMFKGIYNAN